MRSGCAPAGRLSHPPCTVLLYGVPCPLLTGWYPCYFPCRTACGPVQGDRARIMRWRPQEEDPEQHFAWALPPAVYKDTLRLMGRGWTGR